MTTFGVDALPLLAHKIAPRQFDLSYRFSHISLRDQIVRAQMVVRTLQRAGLVGPGAPAGKEDFQLLICGAGVAGLAAAKEAHARGISFMLIEKSGQVPGGVLAKKARRYVSTGMYEWPRPNHDQHDYPLCAPLLVNEKLPAPTLTLGFSNPVLIKEFSSEVETFLKNELDDWKQNFVDMQSGVLPLKSSILALNTKLSESSKKLLSGMLNGKVSVHGVPLHDQDLPSVDFEPAVGPVSASNFQFRYIIYAVGFAGESSEYAKGKKAPKPFRNVPFWAKDSIAAECLGFKRPLVPCVGILGSGDGAMQDTLRCLVRPDIPHALAAWDRLMEAGTAAGCLLDSPHVKIAMARVAAADGYATGAAIWTHEMNVYEALDKAFMDIVADLMKAERVALLEGVKHLLRSDVTKVTLVNQSGYFTKAYALNRFMVLLLHALLKDPDSGHQGKLEILSGEVTDFLNITADRRGARVEIRTSSGIDTRDFDLVIIRGGLDRSQQPTQLTGLSGLDPGRAELGRIPPPIRPV